ncbi:MAG TPA: hypothetical protein PK816_18005, partial [Candidatus Cloacimonadota bacterium]|nr:hypothetical protein [Candidatus Cloacimonadota bacterium]
FQSGNTEICDTFVSEEGVFVLYHLINNNLDYDLFIQKADYDGNLIDGLIEPLYNNENNQMDGQFAACSNGQVLVVWKEINASRQVSLYSQKLTLTGTFVWSDKKLLAQDINIRDFRLNPDQSGGAYISWEKESGENIISICYNQMDMNGNLIHGSQGIQIYENTKIQTLSTVSLNNGLYFLINKYDDIVSDTLIYINALYPEPKLIAENNVNLYPNTNSDFIVFDDFQKVFSISYFYQNKILSVDMQDSLQFTLLLEGKNLAIKKINTNLFCVINYDYLNLITYWISKEGEILYTQEIPHNMIVNNDDLVDIFRKETFIIEDDFYVNLVVSNMNYQTNETLYHSVFLKTN